MSIVDAVCAKGGNEFLLPRESLTPNCSPMSALHEKIALRRMLQDFVCQLDATIVESMSFKHEEVKHEEVKEPTASACQFCGDSIIAWQDQQHVFSSSTYLLLQQFFAAPKMMLSKEDIRQDVLFNDDATEGSIRQCILEARKELCRTGLPYRIETIIRKGYRLVAEQ